jgi:hypothetical protein
MNREKGCGVVVIQYLGAYTLLLRRYGSEEVTVGEGTYAHLPLLPPTPPVFPIKNQEHITIPNVLGYLIEDDRC